jgi:hypothetical protein
MRAISGYIVLFIVFAHVPLAIAEPVRFTSPEGFLSLTLPDGWIQIPPDAIERKWREIQAETGTNLDFTIPFGFQQIGRSEWFAYPYAFVWIDRGVPNLRADLNAFDSFDPSHLADKFELELLRNADVREPTYDASNQVIRFVAESAPGVLARSAFLYTQGARVRVVLYSLVESFEQDAAAFDRLAGSVEINDAPYTHGSQPAGDGSAGLIYAIILGGALAFWAQSLSKKRQEAERAQSGGGKPSE